MSMLEQHPELLSLSREQTVELISELWAEIDHSVDPREVNPAIVAELERSMEEYRRDPSRHTTWAAVKSRILADRKAAGK